MKFAASALLFALAAASVHYEETFSGDWESRWVQSTKKSDFGKVAVTAGKFFADAEASKGLQTTQDARKYAISSAFSKTLDATKGDGVLVFQLTVKHEQNIDCGGGYLKLLKAGYEGASFYDETAYAIMFGPDICGSTKKVQVIFNYKGENLLWKKELRAESDDMTHLYALVLDSKNQKYEVHVDGEKKESGSLDEDWSFLKPKEIDDATDKKPADWVDEPEMDDPADKKPEGYDDIPATIKDPDAKKPDDWDDEEDGTWEAPTVANPDFKGAWKAKRIPNPAYKGVWHPKKIPNPDYVEDKHLASYTDIAGVGLDVWQVKSGTIIDNILIGTSVDDLAAGKTAFLAAKDAEKAAKDGADDASRKKAEDEAAAAPKEDEKSAEADGDDEL